MHVMLWQPDKGQWKHGQMNSDGVEAVTSITSLSPAPGHDLLSRPQVKVVLGHFWRNEKIVSKRRSYPPMKALALILR